MKGFIKRLFGSRRSPATRGRVRSVRATLTPERMLIAGDVTVEIPPHCGGLLIKIGDDFAIAVDPLVVTDKFRVRCWSTGGRIPQLVTSRPETVGRRLQPKASSLKPEVASLVRTGPGGDYVQDWPLKQVVGHRA